MIWLNFWAPDHLQKNPRMKNLWKAPAAWTRTLHSLRAFKTGTKSGRRRKRKRSPWVRRSWARQGWRPLTLSSQGFSLQFQQQQPQCKATCWLSQAEQRACTALAGVPATQAFQGDSPAPQPWPHKQWPEQERWCHLSCGILFCGILFCGRRMFSHYLLSILPPLISLQKCCIKFSSSPLIQANILKFEFRSLIAVSIEWFSIEN